MITDCPSLHEIQKIYFAELLIALDDDFHEIEVVKT